MSSFGYFFCCRELCKHHDINMKNVMLLVI